MKILLAGGGSGGHVTPLKAIIESLKRTSKLPLNITVLTDRKFYFETAAIFEDDSNIKLKKIFSGKYRRYKSKSFVWHLVHLPTLFKNLRDIVWLGLGIGQSVWYFTVHKPDVVFCKGGFVCVPVGLAARLFRVPLIIHDSDTRPGLTNRILARWAAIIATGMPTSFYPYPKTRMIYTGIPVNTEYRPLTKTQQHNYKATLNFKSEMPVALITGGGNGAVSLNKLVTAAAPQLLEAGWGLIHIAGKGKTEPVLRARQMLPKALQTNWQIEEFAFMPPRLLAADIVVSRTSASTLQECANAQKTVIGIASPHLDDQKMNAAFFASEKAILALDELAVTDGVSLAETIIKLKNNTKTAAAYAEVLHSKFAQPAAADTLAKLLLKTGPSS